jgi:hypothetical protein
LDRSVAHILGALFLSIEGCLKIFFLGFGHLVFILNGLDNLGRFRADLSPGRGELIINLDHPGVALSEFPAQFRLFGYQLGFLPL